MFIYDMLGHHQKYQGYRTYVEAGVDDEIKEFYHRSHTAAVLGDQAFITWVRESQLQEVADKVLTTQVLPGTFSIDHIIRLVADYDNVKPAVLTEVVQGPKKGVLARKVPCICVSSWEALVWQKSCGSLDYQIVGPSVSSPPRYGSESREAKNSRLLFSM